LVGASELLFALMLINSEEKMTFAVGLLTFVGKFSVDLGQRWRRAFWR
jgi:multiple sugar transport system permease protein